MKRLWYEQVARALSAIEGLEKSCEALFASVPREIVNGVALSMQPLKIRYMLMSIAQCDEAQQTTYMVDVLKNGIFFSEDQSVMKTLEHCVEAYQQENPHGTVGS